MGTAWRVAKARSWLRWLEKNGSEVMTKRIAPLAHKVFEAVSISLSVLALRKMSSQTKCTSQPSAHRVNCGSEFRTFFAIDKQNR